MPPADPPTDLPPAAEPVPLSADQLRWHCDPQTLPFETTTDVEPAVGILAQDDAVDSLRFGLATSAPGQNVFVRGLTGTGRMTLVRRLLEESRPACPLVKDCCYVHNFADPGRPRAIVLPSGQGAQFRRRIDRLIDFIRDRLPEALNANHLKQRREELEASAEREVEKIVNPFEQALAAAGLALVRIQTGPVVQTALHPRIEGQPVSPEQFEQLHNEGKINDEQHEAVRSAHDQFQKQLAEIGEEVGKLRKHFEEELQNLIESSARWILGEMVRDIIIEFSVPSVRVFLGELVDDVVTQRLDELERDTGFTELYQVNLLIEHKGDGSCPIVVESAPTMSNLLGTIDHYFTGSDEAHVNHLGIRAGALLRADGGYLILEARDLMTEPGAWKAITRSLRGRNLEISPSDMGLPWFGPSLKPEPLEINVKVILIGSTDTYYFLDAVDPDFSQLFKVLADFDSVMPRDQTSVQHYAAILARIASEEQLLPFDRSAVAAWAEHGARIAARRDCISARFGRLADIAREAAFLATAEQRARVTGDDIRNAVNRTKKRAGLPSRRFREFVSDGTIRIETRGQVIGQINGLAVLSAGPLTYGFPCRVTGTIGAGSAGVINIEREAALSGAIHTKGFYILGGLLRYLLRTDHPLAFDASIAFEQSYGGIDGDSASGAEMCCLLSALTDIPLRQDLAMTGAIDQMGHILAIGAVNEKIEGFYDACNDVGLTGTQGVIIPQSNAGDLMLRDDVVAACRDGKFNIYAVERIEQALELFTGVSVGTRDADGRHPTQSLLGRAVARARQYWEMAARQQTATPSRPAGDTASLPGD